MARNLLVLSAYNLSTVRKKFQEAKEAQRFHHDRKAGENLPVLVPGDPACMAPFRKATRNQWLPATVIGHNSPRSYIVKCDGKKYRRNRKHLHISTYEGNSRRLKPRNDENTTEPLRMSENRAPTRPMEDKTKGIETRQDSTLPPQTSIVKTLLPPDSGQRSTLDCTK